MVCPPRTANRLLASQLNAVGGSHYRSVYCHPSCEHAKANQEKTITWFFCFIIIIITAIRWFFPTGIVVAVHVFHEALSFPLEDGNPRKWTSIMYLPEDWFLTSKETELQSSLAWRMIDSWLQLRLYSDLNGAIWETAADTASCQKVENRLTILWKGNLVAVFGILRSISNIDGQVSIPTLPFPSFNI